MKVRLSVIIPFLVAAILLVATGCATATIPREQAIIDVTVSEASALIQDNINNPNFVILDVRTTEEFNEGHIENAVNIDFYSTDFEQEMDKLNKEQTYLIYCRTGNRSGQAISIMERLGFKNVYHLSPGIINWISDGLPVVK